MAQQVKGGSQNETTLKGLIPVTSYNVTIRAYQDILGPASNVISVQTSGINVKKQNQFIIFFSCFIN